MATSRAAARHPARQRALRVGYFLAGDVEYPDLDIRTGASPATGTSPAPGASFLDRYGDDKSFVD